MVLYKNLQTSTLSLYLAMGKWCRDLLKHVKTHMEIQYIRQKQSLTLLTSLKVNIR